MRVQGIRTQSNKFDSPFLEFRLEFGERAELGTTLVHVATRKAGK